MKTRISLCLFFLFCMSSFVSADEYSGGVQARVVLKTKNMSNGQPIAYLKIDNPEVTVMTVELAPAAETGWHTHPVPVYAYVLSGSLTVEVEGNNASIFQAGDAIIEVVNTRHCGKNNGVVPVRLVVFYTGAENLSNVTRTVAP
ncbi:MAG: cupin domain-containing protein [Methanosarcinales archaeon]|nr:MAG: cupin domain-containing protein [Methanosarcinales archaeon]